MGLSNSINWCMWHRSAYCGNHFPFAFIPNIPETPFLIQLLDHIESVNNGITDTSAAVALEADASRDPTAIWHLPCSYFTGCWWISLSVLAIIPRYSGHCIWDGKTGTRRKRGSSSSVYLYKNPMCVSIWCNQLCPIFAILYRNKEQTCWEPSRTFFRILTKTIFCSDGLMRSFCQNSCWSSQTETVNRDAKNKGMQLQSNSSEDILLFRWIQKHSSALWNDTLYKFQQLACWCPVVSTHKGGSVVAAIMRTLVHEYDAHG